MEDLWLQHASASVALATLPSLLKVWKYYTILIGINNWVVGDEGFYLRHIFTIDSEKDF